MLAGVFFFALMSTITKWMGPVFSSPQLVLFRNIIGLLFIGASVWRKPMRHQGGRFGLLVFRGVIGTLSLYLLFYAIQTLPLSTAATYQYSYPIFLAVLSWMVVGERLSSKEWGAIGIGFLGMLVVFQPEVALSWRNHAIGLGNALLTAVAYLAIRQLGQYYDTRAIVMSFMVAGIVLPLISLGIGSFYAPPALDFLIGVLKWPSQWTEWVGLLGIGLTALVGQLYMTRAFTYDKAGRVAVVGYVNILFSILFGLVLGDAWPDRSAWLGMGLIVLGGWLVSQKKKKN
jgi:drug/metabolite transporter (DMT)-like permease